MINSHSLAEYSSLVLNASDSAELDQRLGLYRLFLKLYEHHRELLNEILDLENVSNHTPNRRTSPYLQGVVQHGRVYLVTNLIKEATQSLSQPQNVWVIGRDRKAALPIQDKRLSRRHAAIQYVQEQGFYLIDLDSTNGSFVNGEPVRSCVFLKDGDQIRLGSLAFNFFLCHAPKPVDPLPPELLHQVNLARANSTAPEPVTQALGVAPGESDREPAFVNLGETFTFARPDHLGALIEPVPPELSTSQQAEILDRFLKRQTQPNHN